MDRHELSGATWIKSSYSDANGGNCLEIAPEFVSAGVPVRDSKTTPDGPVLILGRTAWNLFVRSV